MTDDADPPYQDAHDTERPDCENFEAEGGWLADGAYVVVCQNCGWWEYV